MNFIIYIHNGNLLDYSFKSQNTYSTLENIFISINQENTETLTLYINGEQQEEINLRESQNGYNLLIGRDSINEFQWKHARHCYLELSGFKYFR
jgi:predicted glutamine amidotransferase